MLLMLKFPRPQGTLKELETIASATQNVTKFSILSSLKLTHWLNVDMYVHTTHHVWLRMIPLSKSRQGGDALLFWGPVAALFFSLWFTHSMYHFYGYSMPVRHSDTWNTIRQGGKAANGPTTPPLYTAFTTLGLHMWITIHRLPISIADILT